MTKPAVILLSGGLDSATAAAIAQSQGFTLHALSVDYGQRHKHELAAAARLTKAFGIHSHLVVPVDLSRFGGSALTSATAVPKDRRDDQIATGIPVTYVPARNTILLALALGYAETLGAADLFLGINAVDYSGYPDCRPEFLTRFTELANVATKAAVEGACRFTVHAPLLHMTKAQIIRRGMELGVDYGLTHTCYDPDDHGTACGRCDACLLRLRGFAEAGHPDPLPYQPQTTR